MKIDQVLALRDLINRAENAIRQLPCPGGTSKAAIAKRAAHDELFTTLAKARLIILAERDRVERIGNPAGF